MLWAAHGMIMMAEVELCVQRHHVVPYMLACTADLTVCSGLLMSRQLREVGLD